MAWDEARWLLAAAGVVLGAASPIGMAQAQPASAGSGSANGNAASNASSQDTAGSTKDAASPDASRAAKDKGPPDAPPEMRARVSMTVGEPDQKNRYQPLVRGGIYDRPYLARFGSASTAVAVGGYVDFTGSYLREEGISEGLQLQARRFNLFIASRIADRVRFTSELEFENGTEEIALETAALDVLFHHAVNLRGGVILIPLGKFNLAHDSPLYDVVDRPLVSTQVLAATHSDVGAGLFGAFYPRGGHRITYEAYLVSGLGDGLLAADGTRLAEGRPEAFNGEDNGVPSVVGRVAYVSPQGGLATGEVGYSAYAGIYNRFAADGEDIDAQRWAVAMALDGELSVGPVTVRGEGGMARVQLPQGLSATQAGLQWGLYTEVIGTVYAGPAGWFDNASVALVGRVDHLDLNVGPLPQSEQDKGEETTRITLGASFRPDPGTPLRCVYLHEWKRDVLRNPTRAGGVQCGLASYF